MIKKSLWLAGIAAASSLFFADAAMAQDAPGKTAGDFMVRFRALGVIPADNADIDPIGGDTELSNTATPEIDISYFITDNIALELIAATTHHNVKAKNTDLGDVDLGDTWLLPPTLLLQYHFLSKGTISPYVGAGINYSIFYAVDNPNNGPVTDVDYENSLGWALQAGVDVRIADNWYVNADVKRLFLDTDVNINKGAIKADVDVDPWIFGMGIGYKF